jgi:hypothetical protein
MQHASATAAVAWWPLTKATGFILACHSSAKTLTWCCGLLPSPGSEIGAYLYCTQIGGVATEAG